MASDFAGVAQTLDPFAWRLRAADGVRAALAHNHARLILFAPIMLGAGIALWFLLPFASWRLAALLAALALAVAGFALGGLARHLLLGAGLLLTLGMVAAEYRAASVAAPMLYHRLTAWPITGTIIAREPRDGGAATRLVLERPGDADDPPHRVRIAIPGELGADYRPGAVIRVPATLGPIPGPVLPGGYDPARRAWFEGLGATGRATGPPELLQPAQLSGPARWLDGVRVDLAAMLQQRMPGDSGALAAALLVGEQGGISTEMVEAMRMAGLAHILTVSGYHISMVVAAVLLLTRRLVALWPWLALRVSARTVAAVAAALAGWAYTLLSGAEVPAVRAAIMAMVVLAALVAGRNPLSLRLLAAAALLILLLRPEALLSASFQLSFAAVTGLALLAESGFTRKWLRPHPHDRRRDRLWRGVLTLLATGLVAELILSPIALAHFGRTGTYGVIANMVAIPFTAFVIMPLLAAFLALSAVGLGGLLLVPLRWALELFGWIGTTVAGWPGATLDAPLVGLTPALLLLAGAILAGLLLGRARWLGAPLLAAGLLLAVWPRPALLIVPPAGRQVALADGELHALNPHRRSFQWRAWEQALLQTEGAPIAALPGARCSDAACELTVEGRRLLLGRGPLPAAACGFADIVVLPARAEAGCRPRLLLLDAPQRQAQGATIVRVRDGRMHTQADVAGDHPWSPSALPGSRVSLLGQQQWTGVIAE